MEIFISDNVACVVESYPIFATVIRHLCGYEIEYASKLTIEHPLPGERLQPVFIVQLVGIGDDPESVKVVHITFPDATLAQLDNVDMQWARDWGEHMIHDLAHELAKQMMYPKHEHTVEHQSRTETASP